MRDTTPETFDQAVRWETTKGHYLAAGLCHKCAAQIAWGHQDGAGDINPPCSDCRGLTLPAKLIRKHGTRGAKWLESPELALDEGQGEALDGTETALRGDAA